jgi:two-component system LytT family response regulator
MNQLRISYDRGIRIVSHEQIVRVEALSNYCRIHFTQGYPMTVAKVLHWFESNLPGTMFARVHRSHLVNRIHIEHISTGRNGVVQLRNGERVTVSRRRKGLLMAS